MNKEDFRKLAKWMAWVYAPIILLAIAISILAQYRANEIAQLQTQNLLNDGQHSLH